MKLDVQGIEEIEITDPSGLCNPPVPQLPPGPALPNPFQLTPQPFIPTTRTAPWTITPPARIPLYTRHIHDPNYRAKWGLGAEAIQSAGRDIDKFAENWQAKMTGDEG